ncbi:MAG: AAA family ATPase [Deltaproteobacteria bacterium]|nr:AAA family ATPase [Deltaproteobacteria bacterium]
MARLIYAVKRGKGCTLLSGDIGCGKTTLSRVFIERVFEERLDIGIISNPCADPTEFLKDVLYQFGTSDVPDTKVDILQVLQNKLIDNMNGGKETLLIVDEAQLLSDETLEEIRLLLNFQLSKRFLIMVFLVGQPEVFEKIRKNEPLKQRIAIKYSLRPFNLRETIDYIHFRQKRAGRNGNAFSRKAIERIYDHSEGLPRKINHLCDLAFLVGFGNKTKMIRARTVKDIIGDGTVF